MPLDVEKDLPSLPKDAEPGRQIYPSVGCSFNATHSRPTLEPKNPLTLEELALLREQWSEATSARRVRFERQPGRHGRLRSTPPSFEEMENVVLLKNDDASTPMPQRRWGFFMRKKRAADASKLDEQAPKSTKPSRLRFLKRAKAARSTPNLNKAAKATAQEAPPLPPIPHGATLTLPTTQPPAAPMDEEILGELEIDINDGGIYFTFDPSWRSSRGDVLLEFLSPIPDETSDEIPDSPILHRCQSLDELQFRRNILIPRNQTTPLASGPKKMHPIDELHSFLLSED